ncbi:MAG: single-stranded-DNA-specific exonuclease RecJ [Acidobacteriota bacterium]
MKWNWAPAPDAETAATELARALNLPLPAALPAARVLWSRGYRTVEDARRFFSPTLADLHSPDLLKDMDRAVARVREAIEKKQPILLYGDYDVDGTSAVVILKKGFELLGGQVSFHVPHRLRDGYGMRSEVVEEAAAKGVALIVSVDTGIRANLVVEHARGLGIDCIVTDHHLPEAELPPAVAVLNPNRQDCSYPEKNLCGAGVAFKLIDALLTSFGWQGAKRDNLLDSFLKLAAIATVADVVPLTGENRVIVKRGLQGLDQVRNPGLRALLDVSGFPAGKAPSASEVAFRVAPRINAAGRMASASDVIEMFLTSDPERATTLANQLHELNKDRQQTEAEIAQTIFKLCLEQPVTDQDAALIFAGEGWHRGVVGIVASRVVERFHRPAFVLGIENGVAQGSGRSIPAFHLLDGLESMPELFTKFGGHRQAAGLTMSVDQLEEFRSRFRAYAGQRLTPADFERELTVDAEIAMHEISNESVAHILSLAPFGFGNPAPMFALRNVESAAPPDIKNEKHVFARFKQGGKTLRAKAWSFAERAGELAPGLSIDLAVQFEDDAYSAQRGYAPWQTIIRDVRAAQRATSGKTTVAGKTT